jgi:hypothetical protein
MQPTDQLFSTYSLLTRIGLSELISDNDTVARVEQSASEGFCVEVIKWKVIEAHQPGSDHWARFAFTKVFDEKEALDLADKINAKKGYAKIFHSVFPNYYNTY